jgi:hypothetical protein
VTSANFDILRRRNFGLRSLADRVTVERLIAEIRRYDPADAALVSRRARQDANLDSLLDRLELLYTEVLRGARRPQFTPQDHAQAVARFMHEYLPRHPGDPRWPWLEQRTEMSRRIRSLEAANADLGARTECANGKVVELSDRLAQAEQRCADQDALLQSFSRSRLLKFGRILRTLLGRVRPY